MIDPQTIIEENVKIYQPELVNIYCKSIGKNSRVGAFVEIGRNVVIGNNVSIGAFCFIPEGWYIGNDVFIGPRVTFLNDKYPPSKGAWKGIVNIVEDAAVIGGCCTILPGVMIGARSCIAAGSLVTKTVEPKSRVIGFPARQKG